MNMLVPMDLLADARKSYFDNLAEFGDVKLIPLNTTGRLTSRFEYVYKEVPSKMPVVSFDVDEPWSWPVVEYADIEVRMLANTPWRNDMKPAPHVTASDLRKAADEIERRGLVKTAFYDGDGGCSSPICSFAALAIAAAGGQKPGTPVHELVSQASLDSDAAIRVRAAAEALVGESAVTGHWGETICSWNNNSFRSGPMIVEAMRATAARLDAE